jgi:hypothetical protein
MIASKGRSLENAFSGRILVAEACFAGIPFAGILKGLFRRSSRLAPHLGG